jgi:hypothetical protein
MISKRFLSVGVLGLLAAGSVSAQTYLDLKPLFDADVFLEPGGVGDGTGLDAAGRRIDAASLPATFQDESVAITADGRANFRFAPLKQPSLDAVVVNGQVLDVTDGRYTSVDLAMLAAPGAFGNPFTEVELRYADGSKESRRLGPVPGWFNSPSAFDHTVFRFTDDSQVQSLLSFSANFGDAEAEYIVQQRGNGNAGGVRFIDGTGYALYRIGGLTGVNQATLGITVGNNFVISLAAYYSDPDFSTTEGYTVAANSMQLYDGFEHRALGNLKQYTFELAPYLAEGTGEIYVLFTDATPSNGWGPYLQQINVFTGQARTFEETLTPPLDTSKATVYAAFRAGDATAEKPYLYDNSGSGPSNRGHRFADASGSITYRFDLSDEVASAKLTVDLANNFVVSISGPSEVVRYESMTVGTPEEKTALIDEGGSVPGGDFRFADGYAYMVYQFDLPDDVTTAFAQIHIGNQFVIEAAAGTEGDFRVEKDWVAETGEETRDNSNLDYYFVDLAPTLVNNPTKVVRLRFSDGQPGDGWGPFLKSIVLVNKQSSGQSEFQTVLDSQQLYGEDIRNEYNKGYYTVDLTSVLANNPKREVFVKFTDGSKSDGWGPGIFWMAVYSGELGLGGDRLVFPALKTTTAEPANYGVGLLHRRYSVNEAKTLSAIALPVHPASETSKIHLLGATLNAPTAPAQLRIARVEGGNVQLAWPASQTGYRLQNAPALANPSAWSEVATAPRESGGEWIVEVPATGLAQFYRLIR